MATRSNGNVGPFLFRLAMLAAPTWLALALVAVPGTIPLAAAAGIGLIATALAAFLAWRDVRERRAIAAYAADLAEADMGAPPPAETDANSEILWAMRRLAVNARQRVIEASHDGERLAAIFERLPEPLLMLDHRRRITQANGAARRLLGDDLEGQGLPGVLRQPQVLIVVDAALGGRRPEELEITISGRQERQFLVNAVSGPGDGERRSAVLMLHDVTMIRAAESMRVDFVSNVSHELRTPLASLVGFIETLQGPAAEDSAAREQFLAIMSGQAARMESIVNDLLSLSRIELDERVPPTGTVDLGYVIRGVAEALSPRAEALGTTIDLRLPEIGPRVVGDADQLAQVFSNLLDNALKYGGESGRVEVTATYSDDGSGLKRRARIAVRDFGPGIARAHIPRLTERFYRVDTARSRALGGTGLGLAIVKHVVSRHQGELRVESEIGTGSEFAVLLPVAPD